MIYKNDSLFILFTSKRNMPPGIELDLDEEEHAYLKKFGALTYISAITPKPIEDTKEEQVHATTPPERVTKKKTTVRTKPSTTKKKATVRRRNGTTKSSV
jgi:hypothetical protein